MFPTSCLWTPWDLHPTLCHYALKNLAYHIACLFHFWSSDFLLSSLCPSSLPIGLLPHPASPLSPPVPVASSFFSHGTRKLSGRRKHNSGEERRAKKPGEVDKVTMTSPAKALLQLTRFAQKRSKIETSCCFDFKIATIVSAFSLATRKQELIFPSLGNTGENLKYQRDTWKVVAWDAGSRALGETPAGSSGWHPCLR